MFNIFKRTKKENAKPDFSLLKADVHSHLLPGIDDGSPDMDTSLRLIRGMMELGYSKLITTPHIMWDMYQNTNEIILEKQQMLQEAVKAEGLEISIHAAAEYFLDEHVEQLLNSNQPLLTISGNKVLAEFSMAFPSHSIKDILFQMQMQGYQPVIAHPERYIYLEKNKEFYDELKETGCLFQLNILSLTGHYGKSVAELAQYLVKKEYYDLVGTDLHSYRHLESLHNPALTGIVQKLMESGKIQNPTL